MVTQLVFPTFAISSVFLILSLFFPLATSYNCPRVEMTGWLQWGPSWNWYKLCAPSDHECKHCPQDYTRVYCHLQPEPGQDQPVICSVCFHGYNFYGPKCTTNGKLITKLEEEEKKEDKSAPKPEAGQSRSQEPGVGQSTSQEPEAGQTTSQENEKEPKIMAESKFAVEKRVSLNDENQSPKSNPEPERGETDSTSNTSLMWLGIGGLIVCPFIVVIANGAYKRRHSVWTRIQEVREMSNISNTSTTTV